MSPRGRRSSGVSEPSTPRRSARSPSRFGGLVGEGGILPARELLRDASLSYGAGAVLRYPTVLWLNTSDPALIALSWGGFALGLLVFLGFIPRAGLATLWLGYLSLNVVGNVFLTYQWDLLLLVSGLLGVALSPGGFRLSRAVQRTPVPVLWLFRWLLFRLMFLSGVVKLRSGDPSWAALRFHYETQPIPAWTSWYAHQLPPAVHTWCAGYMFWAELVSPFLIFGPRVARHAALATTALLQVGILATGNYGFFNLLTLVLCVSLTDDRDWEQIVRRESKTVAGGRPSESLKARAGVEPVRTARVLTACLVVFVLFATGGPTLELIAPRWNRPWPLVLLNEAVEPFRSFNTYGLFAVMTTERPEIGVQGSDDGIVWRTYRFRWKAGDPGRAPRFCTPHLPRLDWQMWFAALGAHCQGEPWFLRFERRLLQGSPAVLSLLEENPFPDRAPRFVRARLWSYRLSRVGEHVWWDRKESGWFCPPVELADFPGP